MRRSRAGARASEVAAPRAGSDHSVTACRSSGVAAAVAAPKELPDHAGESARCCAMQAQQRCPRGEVGRKARLRCGPARVRPQAETEVHRNLLVSDTKSRAVGCLLEGCCSAAASAIEASVHVRVGATPPPGGSNEGRRATAAVRRAAPEASPTRVREPRRGSRCCPARGGGATRTGLPPCACSAARATITSPGRSPARAAGDPGVTASTIAPSRTDSTNSRASSSVTGAGWTPRNVCSTRPCSNSCSTTSRTVGEGSANPDRDGTGLRRDVCDVDPDHLSGGIDERPARVARRDGGVGLDEID